MNFTQVVPAEGPHTFTMGRFLSTGVKVHVEGDKVSGMSLIETHDSSAL